MAKGDRPEEPPPRPKRCEDTYHFSIDQIVQAGNVERLRELHIGAPVEVRLDPDSHAAVYSGEHLLGWPSRYGPELEECLKRGYHFAGRIVDEGGIGLPQREVQVAGVYGA